MTVACAAQSLAWWGMAVPIILLIWATVVWLCTLMWRDVRSKLRG